MSHPTDLSDLGIPLAVAHIRSFLEYLGRQHGVEPPAGTRMAELLEFLEEIDVAPGAFFYTLFPRMGGSGNPDLITNLRSWARTLETIAKITIMIPKLVDVLAETDLAKVKINVPPRLEPLTREDGKLEALRGLEALDEAARKLLSATETVARWRRGKSDGES